MTVPLSTHGYIWPRDVPIQVSGDHPEVETEVLRPEIMARETGAPKLKVRTSRPVRPSIRPGRRTKKCAAKGGR